MKDYKLTLKKLLVVALAVILLVVCISSSGFSWFTTTTSSNTRPYSSTGGMMTLSLPAQEGGVDSPLVAYDGESVTMQTFVSSDDGRTFSTTAAAPATSGSLGVNPYDPDHPNNGSNRVYYKTEITNGKTTPQNVSLYIKNFAPTSTSGGNVCVGVNQPIKAFKNYSMTGVTIPAPTKTSWKATTKRIYFKPVSEIPSGSYYSGTKSNWSPPSGTSTTTPYYYVKSGNNSAYNHTNRFYRCTDSTTSVWYADIPWDDNQLYIYYLENNQSNPNDYQRTQDFTDLHGDGLTTTQSLCFYLNGTYTDYNNVWAGKYTCTGANVANFYNNVTISNVSGQTVDVSIASGDYSSNATIEYYSSDTSKFTIDSSTGVITPVAAGSAYIKYRVTSEFGETRDFGSSSWTKVTVKNVNTSTATIKNAPIVTNLYIPAATTAGQANADMSNVQVVYWFIQNGDPLYGVATATGTYTLDGIYLGL